MASNTPDITMSEQYDWGAEIALKDQKILHLQNSLNDAQHMLSHYDKQGKNRYADDFYKPSFRKIIDTLYRENEILLKKLSKIYNEKSELGNDSSPSLKQLIIENRKLADNITELKAELQKKFKENQRLTHACENKGKVEKSLATLSQKYEAVQEENRKLKSLFILQDNTTTYLKKIVDSLRGEFLLVFSKCYAEHGQEFLEAMTELEEKGIPEFLKKPITRDQKTSTKDIETMEALRSELERVGITKKPNIDHIDSGNGSLNDELRQQITMLRNAEVENEKKNGEIKKLESRIEELQNDIKRKDEDHEQLLKEIKRKDEDHEQILKEMLSLNDSKDTQANSHSQIETLTKQVEDAKNECLSWIAALTEKTEEAKQFRKERDEALDRCGSFQKMYSDIMKHVTSLKNVNQSPQAATKTTTPSVSEPWKDASQKSWYGNNQRSIVVHDGGSTPSKVTIKRQSNDQFSKMEEVESPTKRKTPQELSGDGGYWTKYYDKVENCPVCGEGIPKPLMDDHLENHRIEKQ